MPRLTKSQFTDKRQKPITVKKTRISGNNIPFQPTTDTMFKKGGTVHRGQGIVMKFKKTKTI
jgi:hypothetical protein